MIIQIIFDCILGIVDIFFDLIDFSDLNNFTEQLVNQVIVLPKMFYYVAYFIDSTTIKLLIHCELLWINFKIVWAIVLRIKSFIPTISST